MILYTLKGLILFDVFGRKQSERIDVSAVSAFNFTANQFKCYVQVLSKTSARNCLINHLINKTYLF